MADHPPNEGTHGKNKSLASLATRRNAIVTASRRTLVQLLLTGRPTVMADDIRASIELPEGIDPRFFGTVPGALAQAGIIGCTGHVRSTRPEAHARLVSVWELADREAAIAWLRAHPEAPAAIRGRQLQLFNDWEGGAA